MSKAHFERTDSTKNLHTGASTQQILNKNSTNNLHTTTKTQQILNRKLVALGSRVANVGCLEPLRVHAMKIKEHLARVAAAKRASE